MSSKRNRHSRDNMRNENQRTDSAAQKVKADIPDVMPKNQGSEKEEKVHDAHDESYPKPYERKYRDTLLGNLIEGYVLLINEWFPNTSRLERLTLLLSGVVA